MPILYIVSFVFIFAAAILIKKSEEKLEITKTVIFTIIASMAYNAFMCYMLNLLNIPITLLTLSIVNYLVSIIIGIYILIEKEIQKYMFEKKNLIITMLFIILSIIILFFMLRGGHDKVRYITGDPQNHYDAVRGFVNNTTLSNKTNYVSPDFMIMGYTNEGIWGKVFQPYIGTVQLFNVYIFFEILFFSLTGITFYFTVDKYCKNKFNYIFIVMFSIIYALGYPLNSWLTGFHYLLIGILYITSIIYAIDINSIYNKYKILLLMLLNFGIIFSYCLFCPLVYLAEFIYFVYLSKKQSSKKIKYLITLIAICLIIPGIMGTSYILIANFKKLTNTIVLEGYIYKNLWSNFILFLPFVIYNLYLGFKRKNISIESIMLFIWLVYAIVLVFAIKYEKCSEYYFFKNYFVLWLIIIIMFVKGLLDYTEESNNKRIIGTSYALTYFALFVLITSLLITSQSWKPKDNIKNTMEIFTLNKWAIKRMPTVLSRDEYELYLALEKEISGKWKDYNDNDMFFITDRLSEVWVRCLTGKRNYMLEAFESKQDEEKSTVKKLNNNTYKYVTVVKQTMAYDIYNKYIDYEKYELIYEGEIGNIYRIKQGEK